MINAQILREYDVQLHVHDHVTNNDSQCQHCQRIEHTVAAVIHATDFDGNPLYAETCLACVIPVIDRHLDIDPDRPVIIETTS